MTSSVTVSKYAIDIVRSVVTPAISRKSPRTMSPVSDGSGSSASDGK
jgi:hypothetical protein